MSLPNLYTTPADLFDYLGTEGFELRLDDHNEATGQTIQATSDAAVGATTINITALSFPLLRGTSLNFDGAGMASVSQVVLNATAGVGALMLTVVPLTVQVNAQAVALDSGINVALAQRGVKACTYGTSKVKLYCCGRYNDSDLAANARIPGNVNRWATAAAAFWLCTRRGQAAPAGVAGDYEEALGEMRLVQKSQLNIEGIGTRTSGWPFIDNFTMDTRYDVTKLRVEPQLSEQTPTQFAQFIDWNSVFLLEW